MAFTIGRDAGMLVFGNKRVVPLSCSIDSASGNVVTGLNYVDFFELAPISMATGAPIIKRNVGSNSTGINGTINIQAAAIGDVFFLVCYGR